MIISKTKFFMKVYFGASITLSRNLPVYRVIVEEIKKLGHEVLSEYVVDPKLKIGEGLSSEKLFERETKTIEKADVMIAEVSTPSWGTAFLMEHALKSNKPVVALFYEDALQDLPMMIEGHNQLFVENYNLDNIKSLLKHYFNFFDKRKRSKGKLIVIDGTDGSGKATQSKLLVKALKKKGKTVRHIEFPRYYSSFHGKVVGRFLKGDFGQMSEVSPYLISLVYAMDRLTARKQIQDWLEAGDVVIADRYTSASMAHQTARVPVKERKKFLRWVEEMEYKQHKIPREDLVLFLHVPVEVSQKLVDKKSERKYVKGKKKDIAEANVNHQSEALKVYLQLAKAKKHWEKVDCVDKKNKLMSIDDIHKKIMKVLKKKKII